MAEEKKVVEKSDKDIGGKPKGISSKLMLIIILLLGLLVAGLGGVVYLVLSGHSPFGGGQPQSQAQAKKDEAPPVFAKLDTFVVNLAGSGGTLLQIDMEAELANSDAQNRLNNYMPKVRSAVILLLSAKTPDELSTSAGKLKLKTQIKQVINGAMDTGGEDPVKSVVFTSFIIQNP